jgi:hypothetical protein
MTGSLILTPGMPRRVKMSWKFTAVAATRTRNSPGPGVGAG